MRPSSVLDVTLRIHTLQSKNFHLISWPTDPSFCISDQLKSYLTCRFSKGSPLCQGAVLDLPISVSLQSGCSCNEVGQHVPQA